MQSNITFSNHGYRCFYKLPPAAPTILKPPGPDPSAVVEYASQYLEGCHATAGIPELAFPPVGTV